MVKGHYIMRHNKKSRLIYAALFVLCVFLAAGSVYAAADAGAAGSKKDAGSHQPPKKNSVKDPVKVKSDETGEKAGETGLISKEYTENDFRPKPDDGSLVWSFIKTLIVLAVLIAVFYYFFRFMSKKTGTAFRGDASARVLSAVPLGQNKSLQVVDIGGRILIIGVSDGSVNLITEITDRDEINRMRVNLPSESTASHGSFNEMLRRYAGRMIDRINDKKTTQSRHKETEWNHDSGIDMSYLKAQRKRLRKMDGGDDED